MQQSPLTFARLVPTPENRAALLAVQDVADCVCSRRPRRQINPLFLHGPTGSGKTHLVSALVEQVTRRCPDLVVTILPAGDLAAGQEPAEDVFEVARHSDLLGIEDLQHLPPAAVEPLIQLLDQLAARGQQMVLSGRDGPQRLGGRAGRFSSRLASRLAAGLVVRLEPPQAPSRLALLRDRAQRLQLAVGADVLTWLAEHLTGGSRQLLGALTQLETLARVSGQPLDLPTVARLFREQAEASQVTVEQIALRVGGYFQVRPEQLQSRRRYRNVLLPRQVGMYLARQLTELSLEQIGTYFGGRDHSTVLHACRKVERALNSNAVLSGAVRQLHADLA